MVKAQKQAGQSFLFIKNVKVTSLVFLYQPFLLYNYKIKKWTGSAYIVLFSNGAFGNIKYVLNENLTFVFPSSIINLFLSNISSETVIYSSSFPTKVYANYMFPGLWQTVMVQIKSYRRWGYCSEYIDLSEFIHASQKAME